METQAVHPSITTLVNNISKDRGLNDEINANSDSIVSVDNIKSVCHSTRVPVHSTMSVARVSIMEK